MNIQVESELPFEKIAQQYVKKDNPTILEIGCNDGSDTLNFLRVFPKCRIYCFEPLPRAASRFERTVCDPRVTLMKCGVGNINGTLPWYSSHGKPPNPPAPTGSHGLTDWPKEVWEDWDLSGSFKKPTGHIGNPPWVSFAQDAQLPCVTLDTWMLCHPEVTYIDWAWIDVQGAEREVLRGGTTTFPKIRWVFTEVFDRRISGNGPQLYENQPNIDEIMALLPGFAFVSAHIDQNILLRNSRFP